MPAVQFPAVACEWHLHSVEMAEGGEQHWDDGQWPLTS